MRANKDSVENSASRSIEVALGHQRAYNRCVEGLDSFILLEVLIDKEEIQHPAITFIYTIGDKPAARLNESGELLFGLHPRPP